MQRLLPILLLTACAYEPFGPFEAADAGASPDRVTPRIDAGTDAGTDAGIDAGMPVDAGDPGDGGCFVSDEEFCGFAECGVVQGTDRCQEERTVTCGGPSACGPEQACSVALPNQCSCRLDQWTIPVTRTLTEGTRSFATGRVEVADDGSVFMLRSNGPSTMLEEFSGGRWRDSLDVAPTGRAVEGAAIAAGQNGPLRIALIVEDATNTRAVVEGPWTGAGSTLASLTTSSAPLANFTYRVLGDGTRVLAWNTRTASATELVSVAVARPSGRFVIRTESLNEPLKLAIADSGDGDVAVVAWGTSGTTVFEWGVTTLPSEVVPGGKFGAPFFDGQHRLHQVYVSDANGLQEATRLTSGEWVAYDIPGTTLLSSIQDARVDAGGNVHVLALRSAGPNVVLYARRIFVPAAPFFQWATQTLPGANVQVAGLAVADDGRSHLGLASTPSVDATVLEYRELCP